MNHRFERRRALLKVVWVCVLALTLAASDSWAAGSPYLLKSGQGAVWLVQSATGRVLWTRKASNFTPIWAADRRAVALESPGQTVLWREGSKPVTLSNPAIPGSDGKDFYDYAMGGVWSPDKRCFLARYGASGMADVGPTGWGRVFCFKWRRNGSYTSHVLPSPDYATKISWRDNRTALYWTLDENTMRPNRWPRRWRVP